MLGEKKGAEKGFYCASRFQLGLLQECGPAVAGAPARGWRHWGALGTARGWRGRNSWGLRFQPERLQQAALGEARSLCLQHGLKPSALFVPELLLAVIFQRALAQRKALCSELLSTQALGSVALLGPAASLHRLPGSSKLPC